MKNSRLKSGVLVCLGVLFLILVSLSIYAKINGINSTLIIQNDSRSTFHDYDEYQYVDFRIIVNDEEIFNDSLPDSLHFQKVLETRLNFGYNRIEVYSDSSKQYDIKSEYVFFKKYYYIFFSRSIEDVYNNDEYFNLYIDSSYFR